MRNRRCRIGLDRIFLLEDKQICFGRKKLKIIFRCLFGNGVKSFLKKSVGSVRVRRTKGDVVVIDEKALCEKKIEAIVNIVDCYWKNEDAGNFNSWDMGNGGRILYSDCSIDVLLLRKLCNMVGRLSRKPIRTV